MPDSSRKTIVVGQGAAAREIAIEQRAGTAPGVFWLSGFKSDMQGTKAIALDLWAAGQGRGCIRFDYSGHGASAGKFADGTITRWLEESVAVYTQCCQGPQIVVGSSMGGWLALLLARALQGRNAAPLAGLVLIAPAADFTEELMWKQFTPEIRKSIEEKGSWQRPSDYSADPYLITHALIKDGRNHLLMGGLIETGCPVHVLQGAKDDAVPWQHAMELVSRFARDDVVFTLVKDGDHRLSRPEDIERLIAAVAGFDCCHSGARHLALTRYARAPE